MIPKKTKSKQKQKAKTITVQTIKGKLDVTRSGIGYIVVDDASGDVLVRPNDFFTALHGDTVRVKVIKENARTGKKEGKITEVVERKQTEFIGHLQVSAHHAFFVPDTDKPMPDLYIPMNELNGAKHKDRVVARLVKWDKDDKKPVGAVVSIMEADNENDAAMKELLAEAGFPLSFSEDVLAEAAQFNDTIDPAEIALRRDCRDILTFTIDPIDAKDFDDA
ncbi:MAG: ribonuclease R, partial [Sphingobacteriia bacterium]